MPNPPIRPRRTDPASGVTKEWDGSQWVLPAGGDNPSMPRLNVTRPPDETFGATPEMQARSAEMGARNDAFMTWALKNGLMTTGMIAGAATGLGAPALIAGAALGRMGGHVPEALLSATTGEPNDSSFLDEAATGAGEGLLAEVTPRVLGPVATGTGKALRATGRALGDVPGANWTRAWLAMQRGRLASMIGLSNPAATAATLGPPIATELGKRLESAGAKAGSEGLASRISGAWDTLMERIGTKEPYPVPKPTAHAESLASGASKYAEDAKLIQDLVDQGFSDEAAQQIIAGRSSSAPFPKEVQLSPSAHAQSLKTPKSWSADVPTVDPDASPYYPRRSGTWGIAAGAGAGAAGGRNYEGPQSASSLEALASRTGYQPQPADEAAAATDVFDVGLPNSLLDALIKKYR